MRRRQIIQKRIMFVGMDVHQESTDITTAEQGHDGKVAHFGCIGGDLQSLDKAVDKLMACGAELAAPLPWGILEDATSVRCSLLVRGQPRDGPKTGGNQSADISRINRRVQSGAACQAGAVKTMRSPQSKRADCCVYSA
jgi:hypothetical protein